jgi:uncharacterized membrane protein YdjX (TVP38/TMEM64 family)
LNLKKLFLILLIASFAILIVCNRAYFTHDNLDLLLDYLGPWAPVVFILLYSLAPVLFIPGTVMTLIGGLIFGLYWGVAYSLIGAPIGASLAFLAGRYIAEDWVKGQSQAMLLEVKRGIAKEGWRYIAFTRLVPVFPYSILNYAFGLTNISLATFALTSFICLIPGTIAYTYIGYVGHQAAEGSKNLLLQVSLALALIIVISFLRGRLKGS